MNAINYARQDIIQEDIDAVVEVLKSDMLTQGPMVPKFEDCVSKYAGVITQLLPIVLQVLYT